jgi:hypothetical protein
MCSLEEVLMLKLRMSMYAEPIEQLSESTGLR